jgi:hypothetical protein
VQRCSVATWPRRAPTRQSGKRRLSGRSTSRQVRLSGEEDREVEQGIAKLQVHGIGACCPSEGTTHGEAMAAAAAPQAIATSSARREEENEGSNDALGWLLALFTQAWARQPRVAATQPPSPARGWPWRSLNVVRLD